ncbi:hypothetical protein AVEN_148650-1 [Araneus ventricosus]|uniref:Uncharacterized protein n=1 Tax=Araneus ventricosus TaxID=182803 RepID=A0A4Y2V186_ARAVE|nr:hypothetical protein AVEN_163616-1 [Araneus ventricosus]GBO24973.1 hypothetical protein AVEN_148650-1 [Araneus ventricosus]
MPEDISASGRQNGMMKWNFMVHANETYNDRDVFTLHAREEDVCWDKLRISEAAFIHSGRHGNLSAGIRYISTRLVLADENRLVENGILNNAAGKLQNKTARGSEF